MNYTNRKNRKITDFFVDLPVPIPDFPEYWNEGSVVAHPRSLNVIRQLLAERVYTEPIQVYGDLKLVFLNGLLWLPKSTEAMRDAKTMEAAMEDVWTRYPETLPSLEQMGVTSSYDDDSSALNDRKQSTLDRKAVCRGRFLWQADRSTSSSCAGAVQERFADNMGAIYVSGCQIESHATRPFRISRRRGCWSLGVSRCRERRHTRRQRCRRSFYQSHEPRCPCSGQRCSECRCC